MLDLKNLLAKIIQNIALRTGATMTGELCTTEPDSSNKYVVCGSQECTETTIPAIVEKLRFSSGAIGSFYLGTAYTASNVTIAAGWYNYCYIPHRSGGFNGASFRDNHQYGTLLLFGMTAACAEAYQIRIAGGALTAIYKWDVSAPTTGSIGGGTTTYYKISNCRYTRYGRLVIVSIGITCNSPSSWATVQSGLPIPYGDRPVYGACCASWSGFPTVAVSINTGGAISFSGGKAGVSYEGTMYYIAA